MKIEFCPLCNEKLVYDNGYIHCLTIAHLPNGEKKFHYNTSYYSKWSCYYLVPYRITTYQSQDKWMSKIEEYHKHAHYLNKYTTGDIKFVMEVPEMHGDTEEKMRKRLKTFLLLL